MLIENHKKGEKMKNKIACGFILILALFYISMVLVEYNNKNVVIVGKTTRIYYKNGAVSKIKYYDNVSKKYNYEDFKIYLDGNFENAKLRLLDNNEYDWFEVYDKENTKKYTNPLIAYKGDFDLKIYSDIISSPTDKDNETIKYVLNKEGLQDEYLAFKKLVLDLDSDGSKETVYYIDNKGSLSEKYYSLIFLNDNDNNIIINKNIINIKNIINSENLDLINAIDLDNDGKYEIMISLNVGDDSPIYYYFYKYDSSNGTLTKVR